MRHEYVGDVGDYGKFGLLRMLIATEPGRRLGIVWYYSDRAEYNNDGRHDGYLIGSGPNRSIQFRECDRELYDYLFWCRLNNKRHLKYIERSAILPGTTTYFRHPVPSRRRGLRRQELWKLRDEWSQAAIGAIGFVDVVFLDPDNGIRFVDLTNDNDLYHILESPSEKHAYWHEIHDYLASGVNVIAYHHLGRHAKHFNQIMQLLETIHNKGYAAEAIRFRRGSSRCFVVIPALEGDRVWLQRSSRDFLNNWSSHADLFSLDTRF